MKETLGELEDKLYTAPEAADILGVSLRTVYRYIKDGKLLFETRTRSGRYLFTKEAISSFLYPEEEKSQPKLGEIKKEEESLEKPLQFTSTGAVRPLHERDILKDP